MTERKNIRLSGFDYSTSGAYYITICTSDRAQILSDICRGDPCGRPFVKLTCIGRIANEAFNYIEELYNIKFYCRVIMPDHIHFVVFLPDSRATTRVAPTIGRVVGAYKSYISNELRKTNFIKPQKLWQRGYYDHIIRNEIDLKEICEYIENNPTSFLEKAGETVCQ